MGFSRQEHWSGFPFPSPKATIERKKVKSFSRVQLFVTPQTVAYQAPQSMEFSRQEYWSGLPFPSPEYRGIKPLLQYSLYLSSIFFPIWGDKLIWGKTTLVSSFRKHWFENFLVVQWLGLSIPTAEGLSSIFGQVTKIPQVTLCGQN